MDNHTTSMDENEHREPEEQHSDDDQESRPRKRQRKTLSCNDCRRRKLKCDREYPACGRCRRSGHPNTCQYNSGPYPTPDGEETSQIDSRDVNGHEADSTTRTGPIHVDKPYRQTIKPLFSNDPDVQARRLENLEREVAELTKRPRRRLDDSVTEDERRKISRPFTAYQNLVRYDEDCKSRREGEKVLMKGQAFRTKYFGYSSHMSSMAHFPELRAFMKHAFENDTEERCGNSLKSAKRRRDTQKASIPGFKDQEMYLLLPQKAIADALLQRYFDTIETTYRILHIPTFWREYQEVWQDPRNGRADVIVITLLAMAIVRCTRVEEPAGYVGDSSIGREEASLWADAGAAWLNRQSQKHLKLPIFQVHCLLLLAREINSIKAKQRWMQAGNVLRFAMLAGLHREPSSMADRISPFDQEMRRRLWGTIVEIVFLISEFRGLPVGLESMVIDVRPPSNIRDDEFEPNCQSIPPSRPLNGYTSTSFLCICRRSLPLRLTLHDLVNKSSLLPYEDVLQYHDQVLEQLDLVKHWTDNSDSTNKQKPKDDHKPYPDYPRFLLEIQLRNFLVLLHNPILVSSRVESESSHSKIVCFEAAKKILDLHEVYISRNDYTLSFLRRDIVRNALTITRNAFDADGNSNTITKPLSDWTISTLEKSLSIHEAISIRLGRDIKEFWLISASLGLIQSISDELLPRSGISCMVTFHGHASLSRLSRLFYKVLALQDDLSIVCQFYADRIESLPALSVSATTNPSSTTSSAVNNVANIAATNGGASGEASGVNGVGSNMMSAAGAGAGAGAGRFDSAGQGQGGQKYVQTSAGEGGGGAGINGIADSGADILNMSPADQRSLMQQFEADFDVNELSGWTFEDLDGFDSSIWPAYGF